MFCSYMPDLLVKKYRAFQTSIIDDETTEVKWHDVNILVVVNSEKDQIRVFAKKEKTFDVVNRYDVTKTDNGDNKYSFTAVDESGIKCNIDLISFAEPDSYHIATLIVDYKNRTLTYRLKEINP